MPPASNLSWIQRLAQAFASYELQSKEQLLTFLRDPQHRDWLSADTVSMIEGAIQVSDTQVRDVMIPRAHMVVLQLNSPPEELVKVIVESGHSRFPVVGESRDDIRGIFLAKDLLLHYAQTGQRRPFDMRDVMRIPVFIPESKRLNILLKEFRTSRNHMAIVVDEYGGTAGLITIEDVIEQIVGEIDDEYDEVDNRVFIHPSDDDTYLVHALTPIEDFNEYFQAHFSDTEFDTIGGLVMQAFGHLPKRREVRDLGGFHFEVARANNRRIQLLRVKPLNPFTPPTE